MKEGKEEKKKELSAKEKAVVHCYIENNFVGKVTAKEMGYGVESRVSEIINKPHVKEYLHSLITPPEEEIASAREVLLELTRIATGDLTSYYYKNKHGVLVLKPIDDLTAAQRACLVDYNPREGIIRLYDKIQALDKLGKHHKLFTELHESTMNFTLMGSVKVGDSEISFEVGKPAPKR